MVNLKTLKIHFFIVICLCLLMAEGCSTEDYHALVGQIDGTVLNAITNSPIRGCQVISDDYGSQHTDENGQFLFDNVFPGKVKLTYQCNGFESLSRTVNVVVEQKTSANVSLTPIVKELGLKPNRTLLDFGNRTSVLDLILTNTSTSTLSYSITSDSNEVNTDPERGSIVGGHDVLIKVSIDRSKVSEGHYEKLLRIDSADGSIDIQVVFDKGSIVRPSVETVSLTQSKENPTTIIAEGAVTVIGSSNVTNHGFCFSSTVEPTLEENDGFTYLGALTAPKNFSGVIPNLELEKEYRVRAYATNEEGTGYGKTMTIVLKNKNVSIVQTLSAENITETSVTLNGKVADGSTGEYSELGFLYGTSPDCKLKISNVKVEENVNFTADISGLSEDTEYYYRAFGIYEGEENTGEVKTFRTSKTATGAGIICITSSASDIQPTTAKLNGGIESDGKTKIREWGFYYGTNANPSKRMVGASYSIPNPIESQSVSLILTGLDENKEYYFTLYVIDGDNNVIKGSIQKFLTGSVPYVSIDSLRMTPIENENNWFLFEGTATLFPQDKIVIEAGFLCRKDGYDFSYSQSSEEILGPYTGHTYRLVCEIEDNVIKGSAKIYNKSSLNAKAYMILSDGTIVYNNKYQLDNGSIYVSTGMWYPEGFYH